MQAGLGQSLLLVLVPVEACAVPWRLACLSGLLSALALASWWGPNPPWLYLWDLFQAGCSLGASFQLGGELLEWDHLRPAAIFTACRPVLRRAGDQGQ